ncbi:unnamed protein product, partial [Didymodactylos carnosus]
HQLGGNQPGRPQLINPVTLFKFVQFFDQLDLCDQFINHNDNQNKSISLFTSGENILQMGGYLSPVNRQITNANVFCMNTAAIMTTETWKNQNGYDKLHNIFNANKLEEELIHFGIRYCKILRDENMRNNRRAEAQTNQYDALQLIVALGISLQTFMDELPDNDTAEQPFEYPL